MTEQESNICAICGGVKRIEYVIGFEEGVPRDMRVEPDQLGGRRLCPGHPGPAPKHDGRLGEGDKVEIWHSGLYSAVVIEQESGSEDNKHLTPKQALSLLDWLSQEKEALKRMAKEQERAE